MSLKKQPLRKITYLRSHDTEKNHNIVLCGDSRWIKDIELLLEDEWKQLFLAGDLLALGKLIADSPPRILVGELGAYNSGENKIFDLNIPRGTEKLLITHGVTDALKWRRTQRNLAVRGVKCIELTSDVNVASKELSEVFYGLCSTGFPLSEDLQIIQSAYEGFTVKEGISKDSGTLQAFRIFASKFIFDPNEIVAATMLVETYRVWKMPKDTASSLHLAYINAEHSIKDEILMKIITLAKKCSDIYAIKGDISETDFIQISNECNFGRLAKRVVDGLWQEVRVALSQSQNGLRLLKVA